MNQEIKAEWCSRLRDGTRHQGHGTLQTSDGSQCCLDVLMELAVDRGIEFAPQFSVDLGTWYYRDTIEGENPHDQHDVLTEKVMAWAGLDDRNPVVEIQYSDGSTVSRDLAYCNDQEGLDFLEIADVIERSL